MKKLNILALSFFSFLSMSFLSLQANDYLFEATGEKNSIGFNVYKAEEKLQSGYQYEYAKKNLKPEYRIIEGLVIVQNLYDQPAKLTSDTSETNPLELFLKNADISVLKTILQDTNKIIDSEFLDKVKNNNLECIFEGCCLQKNGVKKKITKKIKLSESERSLFISKYNNLLIYLRTRIAELEQEKKSQSIPSKITQALENLQILEVNHQAAVHLAIEKNTELQNENDRKKGIISDLTKSLQKAFSERNALRQQLSSERKIVALNEREIETLNEMVKLNYQVVSQQDKKFEELEQAANDAINKSTEINNKEADLLLKIKEKLKIFEDENNELTCQNEAFLNYTKIVNALCNMLLAENENLQDQVNFTTEQNEEYETTSSTASHFSSTVSSLDIRSEDLQPTDPNC